MAHAIKSPIPGIFYRRPSPDDPVFVEAGDAVKEGDVIGLIEVMKTFHEIKADKAGIVASFAVENEEAVSVGQVLLVLEE